MTTERRPARPFRAIIIGGGVAGLTASHCFAKAGIDHVVLERGAEAAPPLGASIAIYPHGARILQQLGLLEAVNEIADPIEDGASDRYTDGRVFAGSDVWRFIRENHGRDFVFLERRAFLEVMYEALPDKSRVKFGKKVVQITEDSNSVKVHMVDGTLEEGDIIIGCDGVHSSARTEMWERARRIHPNLISDQEKASIQARWQCLLGFGPAEPGAKNEVSVVHDHGYSLMLISPPRQTFFFAFVKIEKPYTPDKRPRYTAQDADLLADRFKDIPVTEGITFGELWKKRFRGQLVDTEDGMLDHWHLGRTVLVGDSVHKMTPNMGFGGNAAIESIAVLTNQLHDLLQTTAHPCAAELTACFQAYENAHKPRMKKMLEFSDTITKSHAWDNAVLKYLGIWVFPYLPERILAGEIGKLVAKATMLNFVPLGAWPEGRMKWADGNMAGNKEGVKEEKGDEKAIWRILKTRKGGSGFMQILGALLIALTAMLCTWHGIVRVL